MALRAILTTVFGADTSQFRKGTFDARRQVGAFGKDVDRLKGRIAAAFTIGAITMWTRRTLAAGAAAFDLGKLLGTTSERAQELKFWMDQNGVGVEQLRVAWNTLAKTQREALAGNEKFLSNFQQLGVTLEDLRSKNVEQIFLQISKHVKDTSTSTDDLRVNLLKIMGEGGARFLPAMKAGFEETAQAARKAGVVIDESVSKSLKEMDGRLTTTSRALTAKLAPALEFVLDKLLNGVLLAEALIKTLVALGTMNFRTLRALFTGQGLAGVKAEIKKTFQDIGEAFGSAIDEFDKNQRNRQSLSKPSAPPSFDLSAFTTGGAGPSAGSSKPPSIRVNDSLAQVGNFLFGGQRTLVTLQQQSNAIARQIAANTSSLRQLDSGGGVPQ